MLPFVRYFHLLAAAVWVGGLITLAALVITLRREGAERPLLQAAARQFARLSWTAMAVAIATGVGQVVLMRMPWSWGRLHVKMGFVAVAVVLAAVHQVTARRSSAAARGAIQGLILLASLGILGAAVFLGA